MKIKYTTSIAITIIGLIASCFFIYYIMIFLPSTLVYYNDGTKEEIEQATDINELKEISKSLVDNIQFSDQCIEMICSICIYFLLAVIIIFILNLICLKLMYNDFTELELEKDINKESET